MSDVYKLVVIKKSGEKATIEFMDLDEARNCMYVCQEGTKDFEGAFVGDERGDVHCATFALRPGDTSAGFLS